MIEEIQKSFEEVYDKGYKNGYKDAKKEFERPHGEWQQVGEMTYRCTHCGWLKKIGLMPYCENCGASMKKEGDENEQTTD